MSHWLRGGHLGQDKTWSKVKERFWWLNAYTQVMKWVESCELCARRYNPNPMKALLKLITEFYEPFDMVGVDVLGPLPTTKLNNKYVEVFTEYLSRWVEAFQTENQEANTIVKLLVNEVIARPSAPRVLSDQG